jgi:alpha/beta hydrolase fold
VLLVRGHGGPPVVVKDWSRRGAWVRALVAPLLVRHELAMLARVAGVPGLPRSHRRIDRLALELEFIEGRPLRRRSFAGALPPEFFAALERMLAGLAERGVAYLDLRSPSNVLVTPSGAPALVDLGSAIALPIPRALRRWLDQRALAKLRKRFERGTSAPPPVAAAEPVEHGRDLKVAGTRFRVREWGGGADPEPLVLLPEAGFSARLLEPIAQRAAQLGRRAIGVDLPGFGGSRRQVRSLRPADVAAQLEALLDALRIARVDVVGAGFGALVAAELARRAPARIGARTALDADPARLRARAADAARDVGSLRRRLVGELPAEVSAELRAELAAELALAPDENLARAFREVALAPTPIGVAPRSWDDAFAELRAR